MSLKLNDNWDEMTEEMECRWRLDVCRDGLSVDMSRWWKWNIRKQNLPGFTVSTDRNIVE